MEEEKKLSPQRNPFKLQMLVLIMFFVAFFALSVLVSPDKISIAINIIVLAVMMGFLLTGMGKLFFKTGTGPLYDCVMDLEKLAGRLNELYQEQPGQAWDVFREDSEWHYDSPILQQAIEKMNTEADALSFDGDYQGDVSDYVNEDLLSSIGNTGFNDFVSNVMTGLGILGTFIGLAIGLQSFDAETAEAMTNSIVPLIEGIKVAFYTSIFGVTFSLIYGTMYHSCLKRGQIALDEFLSAYYLCKGVKPENDVVSRVLQYEKEQCDTMEQLAEGISMELGKILTPTLTSLPEQMSQAVGAQLNPMVESMGKSLTDFTERLSTQMTAAQNAGAENLVETFMDKMNEMTNGQMENLSRTIETICTWQETTVKHLDAAVSGICKNAEDMSKINEELGSTVSSLEKFLAELQKYQEENQKTMLETAKVFASSNERVEQTANELAEISERSGEIMDSVHKITSSVTQQEEVLKQAAEDQRTKLQEASELLNMQVEETKKVGAQLTRDLTEASSKMVSASQSMDTQLEAALDRSFKQFDSQLAKALQHFSGSLTELQDVVEGAPQMVDEVVAKMHKSSADYLKTVEEGQRRFSESISSSVAEITKQVQSVKVEVARQGRQQ